MLIQGKFTKPDFNIYIAIYKDPVAKAMGFL